VIIVPASLGGHYLAADVGSAPELKKPGDAQTVEVEFPTPSKVQIHTLKHLNTHTLPLPWQHGPSGLGRHVL
jgi:hypothetical protein